MPINLVKIDDKVLDLPEQARSGNTGIGNANGIWRINDGPTQPAKNPLRLRYAVKKDGKGWVNDEEQKKALIDDLDYYEDWNEAKQHGVIVGLLFASPLNIYTGCQYAMDAAVVPSTCQGECAYWLCRAGHPTCADVDSSRFD